MKDNRIIYLIACLIFISFNCIGQPHVEKVIRDDKKAYLRIRYDRDTDTIVFNTMDGFENNLTDREKLQLIECLFKFEGDTTRHPGRGLPIYHVANERAIRFSPKSKFYTVEISALYFIDRIAYGVYSDYYSPAPVLYDNEEKIEINNCPEKVKLVFIEYKKWFNECIKSGKIPKYFPFNDGRYVWLRGKKSLFLKNDELID